MGSGHVPCTKHAQCRGTQKNPTCSMCMARRESHTHAVAWPWHYPVRPCMVAACVWLSAIFYVGHTSMVLTLRASVRGAMQRWHFLEPADSVCKPWCISGIFLDVPVCELWYITGIFLDIPVCEPWCITGNFLDIPVCEPLTSVTSEVFAGSRAHAAIAQVGHCFLSSSM
eukprot:1160362-Pelagomonas_calceolata.AAC.4